MKYFYFSLISLGSIVFFISSFFKFLPISIYGIFVFCYFLCQLIFALLNRYNNNKFKLTTLPSVTLIIVGYREDSEYWKNCLESIKLQEYKGQMKIIISIDGSEEEDIYMKDIAESILEPSLILLNNHGGKRSAICEALNYVESKYFILIDSDTILDKSATEKMICCIEQDDKIGCATGNLKVFNTHLLGRIVNARYGYAFNFERGAMSYFGVMNCCSGPLSIYRSDIIDSNFINEFRNQKFLGNICGPGDDRHLTNMVMIRGYKSKQTHLAIAWTEAPSTFLRFLRQQVRWIRSFYREQFWQILAIPRQSIYLSIITQYEILYPFFIFIWLIDLISVNSLNKIIRFAIISGIIIMIRTLMLVVLLKDIKYFLNLFYLPIYLFFILPLKIFSFFTTFNMNWNTSSRKLIIHHCDMELFNIILILLSWNGGITYSIIHKLISQNHLQFLKHYN